MSKITLVVSGNGTAWVDDVDPEPNQVFTLYAYANPPDDLYDIRAQDENGYWIAMQVTPVAQYQYNAAWGNITIYVDFTGTTPPQPPQLMYWLLAKAAQNWRMRL